MRLKHFQRLSDCTSTTTITGTPNAIVNYLCRQLPSICHLPPDTTFFEFSVSSTLTLNDGGSITLYGYPKDILPILSWLHDTLGVRCDYLLSTEDDSEIK